MRLGNHGGVSSVCFSAYMSHAGLIIPVHRKDIGVDLVIWCRIFGNKFPNSSPAESFDGVATNKLGNRTSRQTLVLARARAVTISAEYVTPKRILTCNNNAWATGSTASSSRIYRRNYSASTRAVHGKNGNISLISKQRSSCLRAEWKRVLVAS